LIQIFFISIFILLSLVVFAEEFLYVNTSEARYTVLITYKGKNCGQQITDELIANARMFPENTVTINITLTNGHWECVRRALDLYNTRTGDTFAITIVGADVYENYNVVCEFSSATQYTYWAWKRRG
jgi:hypothetical protein